MCLLDQQDGSLFLTAGGLDSLSHLDPAVLCVYSNQMYLQSLLLLYNPWAITIKVLVVNHS